MKVKKFVSGSCGLFLKLIYHGAGMVVHLLLLKFSMGKTLCKAQSFCIQSAVDHCVSTKIDIIISLYIGG